MKQKKFLTSGEFARLCRTTKETLFHYDREGLLKPKLITGNGYRRYAAEQFFEFDMIAVLKDAGSSLREIREYLGKYDPENFVGILEEKLAQLELEQERLARRRESLLHIAKVTREAMSADYGILRLEEQGEENLVVLKVDRPEEKIVSWSSMAHYLSRHFMNCEELGLTTISPLGSIILQDQLERGIFTENYYFSTAGCRIDSPHFMVKPAGLFAVMLHKGCFDNLIAKLPEVLKEIGTLGVTVSGNAYIYDLLSYLATEKEENDVQRIAIQVTGGCPK